MNETGAILLIQTNLRLKVSKTHSLPDPWFIFVSGGRLKLSTKYYQYKWSSLFIAFPLFLEPSPRGVGPARKESFILFAYFCSIVKF